MQNADPEPESLKYPKIETSYNKTKVRIRISQIIVIKLLCSLKCLVSLFFIWIRVKGGLRLPGQDARLSAELLPG